MPQVYKTMWHAWAEVGAKNLIEVRGIKLFSIRAKDVNWLFALKNVFEICTDAHSHWIIWHYNNRDNITCIFICLIVLSCTRPSNFSATCNLYPDLSLGAHGTLGRE